MVVTTEICDKGLREIQHVKRKVSRLYIGDKLQAKCKKCPKEDKDKAEMRKIPYASTVGSLMYTMVCTRPDRTFVMGEVSRYMNNPRREH